MRLLMSPQESMCTSPQLLLTSHFSSLECLFSGMSFLHQQNLPQCVQLHQRKLSQSCHLAGIPKLFMSHTLN
ncbi:hypothetical protein MC885_003418 [Smutsia gigantea]|nr:hypothetical protein MC885_003418 [Smutsia gigantea]